jgi:very-short-patch-repair endonuclease
VPIEGYITDFICFEARLIVEVDGSQHVESDYDRTRDGVLRGAGFRVPRFWNDEVARALDDACQQILVELKNTGE